MTKLLEEIHEQPLLKAKLYQVSGNPRVLSFPYLWSARDCRVQLSCWLLQVNFHTTLTGHAMVTMIYHKKLGPDWQEAARKLRHTLGSCPSSTRPYVDIIGRSHKQKIELDAGYVCETLTVDGHILTYKQVR